MEDIIESGPGVGAEPQHVDTLHPEEGDAGDIGFGVDSQTGEMDPQVIAQSCQRIAHAVRFTPVSPSNTCSLAVSSASSTV